MMPFLSTVATATAYRVGEPTNRNLVCRPCVCSLKVDVRSRLWA